MKQDKQKKEGRHILKMFGIYFLVFPRVEKPI